MGDVEIDVAGERAVLLPEKGLLRVSDRTLFVADLHVGKAASFRVHGVPVPAGTTGATLARLDLALARTGARRLVVLGDFLHSRAGRQLRTEARVSEWRASWPMLQIELVRGNHDRMAGDPHHSLGIAVRDAPVVDGAFTLRHTPGSDAGPYWLAGHLHPGVSLVGHSRQRLFLPCFHVTKRGMILPAFGDFTGLAAIEPSRGDRVFAIAGNEIVEVRE